MTTDRPLRAVIWCAVSSKAQTKDTDVSLPEQERIQREYCKERGWQIVEVLKVPGHSRSETDIITLLEDYAANGIDAYAKLRSHWLAKDFDALVAFDASRLARSQTLYSYVLENVIRSGASVHLIQGGEINEQNVEMGIAMGGIAATSGIRRLKHMRKAGLQSRMNRGLHMTDVPWTHHVVHDPQTGKQLRLELNEELRTLFDDAAELCLEGVGWTRFSQEMFRRFGHANPKDGKPYHGNYFYRMFHNPYTYGASANKWRGQYGLWAFDETAPLPPGTLINRAPNPPIPPVYTGRQAELLKAELLRRVNVAKGRSSSSRPYRFTGLIICDVCGKRVTISNPNGPTRYYRCHNYYNCTNKLHAREDNLQKQINDFLIKFIALNTPDIASMSSEGKQSQAQRRMDTLRAEIAQLTKELDSLILFQRRANSITAQERYQAQINDLETLIEIKERNLVEATSVIESEAVIQARALAYDELTRIGPESLWERDDKYINQTLHMLMGNYHFVQLNGGIIDVR